MCYLARAVKTDTNTQPAPLIAANIGYGFITFSLPEYSLYHGAEVVSTSRIAPLHQRL